MTNKQEKVAKDLYSRLLSEFGYNNNLLYKIFKTDREPRLKITVEGAGVHWNCKIADGIRECVIHCFYYDWNDRREVEYYILFNENNKTVATARTIEIKNVLNIIRDWMNYKTLAELYKSYKFVDEYKRKLNYIHNTIIGFDVELENCDALFEQSWSDFYDYTVSNGDKSIKYYVECDENLQKNGFGFKFLWDECAVFYAYNDDLMKFDGLIKEWLINQQNPSILKSKYPWIDLYNVAEYYERGEGLLGEYIESWNKVEKFYLEDTYRSTDKIIEFIRTIRKDGYDKEFRAGNSLNSMILSRSRRHGLSENQAYLSFWFGEDGINIYTDIYSNINEPIFHKGIYLSDEIRSMLDELKSTEIS